MIKLPMLASDWDPDKIRFPAILQPKIDGVRGLNPDGDFVGRSFKSFKNEYATAFFSNPIFTSLDGEVAAEHQCHPRLCSLTTSALNTIEGTPYLLWWVFDYVTEETVDWDYEFRLKALYKRVEWLKLHHAEAAHLRPMPYVVVESMEHVLQWHAVWRAEGYEGSILRDPAGKYKNGRSTVKEGGLLRIKDFVDCEGIVRSIVEGKTNNNEAKINELGYTERSTHQANMFGNKKVGTIVVELLQDQVVNGGAKTIPKGFHADVSPGRMTHDERERYLANPDQLLGQIVKLQHFPHGVKDKLRMATFQSIRMKEDMS